MGTTDQLDASRTSSRSFLPQGRLFWGGVALGIIFLLVGGLVVTGPVATMMAIWGLTLLFVVVGGYAVYRIWYSFGA